MHCNFNDLNVQLIQSFTDYEIILIQYLAYFNNYLCRSELLRIDMLEAASRENYLQFDIME